MNLNLKVRRNYFKKVNRFWRTQLGKLAISMSMISTHPKSYNRQSRNLFLRYKLTAFLQKICFKNLKYSNSQHNFHIISTEIDIHYILLYIFLFYFIFSIHFKRVKIISIAVRCPNLSKNSAAVKKLHISIK